MTLNSCRENNKDYPSPILKRIQPKIQPYDLALRVLYKGGFPLWDCLTFLSKGLNINWVATLRSLEFTGE